MTNYRNKRNDVKNTKNIFYNLKSAVTRLAKFM